MKDPFASFVNKIAKKTAANIDRKRVETQARVKAELAAMNPATRQAMASANPAFLGKELDFDKAKRLADEHGVLVETVKAVYMGR